MTVFGFDRDVLIVWQGRYAGFDDWLRDIDEQALAYFVNSPQHSSYSSWFCQFLEVYGRLSRIRFKDSLQDVTASILEIIGVDFVRTGNQLVVNDYAIAVGETCNGMAMIFALGLVVFVFVFSLPLKNTARVALLLASPLIALFCNVLRLVPTSLVYGLSDSELAESVYAWSAWIMIPLAIFMLVGVLRMLSWMDLPVTRWRLVTT